MTTSYSRTRILVEGAMMIALATVLSMIKIFEMPFGGSVTLLAGGRTSASELPEFTLESTVPVDVEIHAAGKIFIRHLGGTEQ